MAIFMLACSFATAEPEKKLPNDEWARPPLEAVPEGGEPWSPNPETVQVVYKSSGKGVQVPGPADPSHVRAKDDKVIIHPDTKTSYNAGGGYVKDGKDTCCNICPRNKDCDKHGMPGCYSKCHHFCGPQCIIPQIDLGTAAAPSTCVIGVDCGMSAVAQGGISTQDMNKDWKNMKSEKSDNTPDKPNPDWARPPLSAQGATGPAPLDIPVHPADVHGPSVIDATGAAAPTAPGQPLPVGADGPSTPSEQQAHAAAAVAKYAQEQAAAQAMACGAPQGVSACSALPGCNWCSMKKTCVMTSQIVQMSCGEATGEAALLQTGTRYTTAFRHGKAGPN